MIGLDEFEGKALGGTVRLKSVRLLTQCRDQYGVLSRRANHHAKTPELWHHLANSSQSCVELGPYPRIISVPSTSHVHL